MKGNRIGTAREHIALPVADTFDAEQDLDYIAIERALNGDRTVYLTPDEKLYAARLLDERGMAAPAIGVLVRSTGLIVAAWKANGWRRGAPALPGAGVAA